MRGLWPSAADGELSGNGLAGSLEKARRTGLT
jgi:hypothetical protein